MTFTPRNWVDGEEWNAAAVEDVETRLSAYTDQQFAAFVGSQPVIASMNPLLAIDDVQPTLLNMYLMRCVIPVTGTLRDVAIFPRAQAGNVIAAVYDTGTATATVRTKLWDSGSVVLGAAASWQIVGSPALAVTVGQHVDIGVLFDSTTARFAGVARNSGLGAIPAAFMPVAGGVTPTLAYLAGTASFAAPASIASGTVNPATNKYPAIIARIA